MFDVLEKVSCFNLFDRIKALSKSPWQNALALADEGEKSCESMTLVAWLHGRVNHVVLNKLLVPTFKKLNFLLVYAPRWTSIFFSSEKHIVQICVLLPVLFDYTWGAVTILVSKSHDFLVEFRDSIEIDQTESCMNAGNAHSEF